MEQLTHTAAICMDNPEYTKVFSDLMRRVSMLEEEIRLYNTQVVEVEVHKTELGNPPLCPQGCHTNKGTILLVAKPLT